MQSRRSVHGRIWVVGLTMTAVLASGAALTPATSTTADPHSRVEDGVRDPKAAATQLFGPWAGDASVEIEETIVDSEGVVTHVRTGTATYSDLKPIDQHSADADAINDYAADADVTFDEQVYGWCDTERFLTAATHWTFTGPSTSQSDAAGNWMTWGPGGSVLEFRDNPDGTQTYVRPVPVIFNGLQDGKPCNGSDPEPALQANDTASFHAGHGWYFSQLPLHDTDPDPLTLVGSTTWSLANPPAGDPPYTYATYEFTLTYSLTRGPGLCGGGAARTSSDGFEAALEGKDEPILQFEVATSWCDTGGVYTVVATEAEGRASYSPLQAALQAAVREWFTVHEAWKNVKSRADPEGGTIEATGIYNGCFGIPLLGKVKYLKKAPGALRFVGKLIKKVERSHPNLKPYTRKIDKALRVLARTLEYAIDKGGRFANKAVAAALETLQFVIEKLPQARQVDILIATTAVVADWFSSGTRAKKLFADLADWGRGKLLDGLGPDPLTALLSDELVCVPLWHPRITQRIGAPGNAGDYSPGGFDLGDWDVARYL